MDKIHLISLIISGRFDEAESYLTFNNISETALESIIIDAAHQQNNIATYSFIFHLILKNETAKLHQIACVLMSNPLCFLEGAYSAAYYHANRAVQIEPSNVASKELLIFLHVIPDELVSKDEAIQVAKEILDIEPQNKTALSFLKEA